MPATIAIDARDAVAADLRGWGRHARDLIAALPARDDLRFTSITGSAPGPEILFEQAVLPVRARRLGADVLHVPNCFLPLRRPCPGVVTIHDLAFEKYPEDFEPKTGWKYRTFTPRAARSAERVICVSRFTADDVIRRYGVDEAKVRVIPNAPSLPVGSAPVPEGTPYLLAIGDLRQKKNLRRLVEAHAELRAGGLEHELILAGLDIGEGSALMQRPGVRLTGYISDAELDALLRGADALVHPSLYEGYGLVIPEAMVRGVPVVLSRATALPETGGDAAEYFDPEDTRDMAAAIARVVGDRERHADLVRRGHERAAGVTWEHAAALTVAVYEELL